MKTLIALLTISMLTGCGLQMDSHDAELNIVSEAQSYVTQFEIEGSRLQGTPMKINDLIVIFDQELSGKPILGTCTRSSDTPVVRLNPKFWFGTYYYGYYVSNSLREALVFHELGHCILNRKHSDVRVNTVDQGFNIQASLMSTYMLSRYDYEINHEQYLMELFGVPHQVAMYSYGSSQFATTYPATTTASASTIAVSKAYAKQTQSETVTYTTTMEDLVNDDGTIKLGCAEAHSHGEE